MWTKENTEAELIQGVIKHGPSILEGCLSSSNLTQYLSRIELERLDYPKPTTSIDLSNWFIPDNYKNINIEDLLYSKCPLENQDRLKIELELYKKNNMIPVLKVMKFIVDTLRDNKIVWGVGRGSSVASYALFLLDVHRIDSVKYNIPIEEFFKET